jgi:hypothetical protein
MHFSKKAEGMFMRWKMAGLLRDTLRSGDAHALRTLFATKGYVLGVYCQSPTAERIVLEEALEGRTTGELLLVFFRELGGRHQVWRELIHADASRLMQGAKTMAGVVSLLVDELGVPMPHDYEDEDQVLRTARDEGGWNVVLALGQKLMSSVQFERRLNDEWAHRLLTLSNYRLHGDVDDEWFAHVLLPMLSDKTLVQCHVRRTKPQLIEAELERRRNVMQMKQVMLLMRKRDNAPFGLVRVFEDPLLAYHILQEIAFKDEVERLSVYAQQPY